MPPAISNLACLDQMPPSTDTLTTLELIMLTADRNPRDTHEAPPPHLKSLADRLRYKLGILAAKNGSPPAMLDDPAIRTLRFSLLFRSALIFCVQRS